MRKLHNDGKPIDVSAHLGRLEAALREVPGLAAVYLFGSYGTKYQTPLSDVDLGLVFTAGGIPDAEAHVTLIVKVTEALREDDVSVTVLNRAPLPLRHKVLAQGRQLFVFDDVALADFIEQTLGRYLDYQVDYARFLREYDTALVEEYGSGAG